MLDTNATDTGFTNPTKDGAPEASKTRIEQTVAQLDALISKYAILP